MLQIMARTQSIADSTVRYRVGPYNTWLTVQTDSNVLYILPDSLESVYDPGGDILYYEPKSTLRLDGRLGELLFVATYEISTSTVTVFRFL